MEIVTEFKTKVVDTRYQEVNIYKLKSDENWSITTTIPKYARQYEHLLLSGRCVRNKYTNAITELHGTLKQMPTNIPKQ